MLESAAENVFEENTDSTGDGDRVVLQAVDLQKRDVARNGSEQGGKLRGHEKYPGLNSEVDRLTLVHATYIGNVADNPVKVVDSAEQQRVIGMVIKVDNRKLVSAVEREHFDAARCVAWDVCVDPFHAFLERARLSFQ